MALTQPIGAKGGCHSAQRPSVASVNSGKHGPRSARAPDAVAYPDLSASFQVIEPTTRPRNTPTSISTTLGGVPRLWAGPRPIWTAPAKGTRTSTLRPGQRCASSRRAKRAAVRAWPDSRVSPAAALAKSGMASCGSIVPGMLPRLYPREGDPAAHPPRALTCRVFTTQNSANRRKLIGRRAIRPPSPIRAGIRGRARRGRGDARQGTPAGRRRSVPLADIRANEARALQPVRLVCRICPLKFDKGSAK